MTFMDRIQSFSGRRAAFIILLLAVTALLRLPTLFNDFYEADELAAIVQTWEYLAGDVPGVDFSESKLPLYHAIFKLSYHLWPEKGWVVVHGITIFIVFFTALFLYLAGSAVRGFSAGALASILYAVLISSFNRHFMATNGEIVYNLPLAGGLWLFVLYLKTPGARRYLHLAGVAAMAAAASRVKFHGIILAVFVLFFLAVFLPYLRGKIGRRYLLAAGALAVAAPAAVVIDYSVTGFFAPGLIAGAVGKLYYAFVKGSDPLVFAAKFIHRQGLLVLWHFAAWVPAAAYVIAWARGRFRGKSAEESAAALFFSVTWLMVFAGGSRLYHHYFMAAYPGLCLVAALAIDGNIGRAVGLVRRRLAILIIIPALFFLAWNAKDAVIRNFFPQAFYNEGKALYWARAALVGHFNDYLLPESSYRGAAEYIERVTRPGDRIFVWGDGPYLYYFARRRMGVQHLWPKTGVIRIRSLYEADDGQSRAAAEKGEKHFIGVMERKRPVLFIDTSENGLTGFTFPVTPLLREYVDANYEYLATVDRMRIYARKGYAVRK